MQEGKRYRIRYRSDAQRFDREDVLDYLGENRDYFTFSARPIAGTQDMPKGWVKSSTEVPKSTPITMGRRA